MVDLRLITVPRLHKKHVSEHITDDHDKCSRVALIL